MENKNYSLQDIVYMDSLESMKKNIIKLGQKRTLEIINGDGLILSKESRRIYKRIYFESLHRLEIIK